LRAFSIWYKPPKGVCEYIILKKESDPKMKKNTSRILSLILALMLIASAFALSSCDDATGPVETDTGTPTSSDTPSDTGSPTASDDPEPTEPPAPGTYLGGSTFDPEFDPEDPLCAAYVVPTSPPTTASIEVTLVIEAGNVTETAEDAVEGTAFREHYPVTLPSNAAGNTVEDLLKAVEANSANGLTFDITGSGDPGAHWPAFLNSVTYDDPDEGSHTWEPRQYAYDGWVFRVNDKFPVKLLTGYDDTYYEGTLINETYLNDGDIVHFFFDFPATFSASLGPIEANYVRADPIEGDIDYDPSSHTLTVPLQFHYSYIAPGANPNHSEDEMQVWDYDSMAYVSDEPITGRLRDLDGTIVPGGEMTFDIAEGTAVFAGAVLTPGTEYIVETDHVLRDVADPYYINDAYFYLTGAYSRITVPD
jgi:hypothetical protein